MRHHSEKSRTENAVHHPGRKERLIDTVKDAAAPLAGLVALPAGVLAMGLCAVRAHEPHQGATGAPGAGPVEVGASSSPLHAGPASRWRIPR